MQLDGKTIVLTGAAGGMGELLANQLAARGARLILTDLNAARLKLVTDQLGSSHIAVAADLCTTEGREQVLEQCRRSGGIDVLINVAGLSDYSLLTDISPAKLQLMTMINLTVPMLMCQALVPLLARRPEAAIVNMGSTFGSIGHPGFAVYCAGKFGLRGFSEALRRELSDTNVRVFYLAPRATRTDMNSAAVVQLNKELGNAMDDPQVVVDHVMRLLTESAGGDYFLGWPEKLFVRINGLLPAVVDKALGKQLATIKRLAT